MRIIYVSTSISDASESIILFADGYTTLSSSVYVWFLFCPFMKPNRSPAQPYPQNGLRVDSFYQRRLYGRK